MPATCPLPADGCDYDAEGPCPTHYPYRHAADGVASSEPCPGLDTCSDCGDVLAQIAETPGAGEFLQLTAHGPGHGLIVDGHATFTTIPATASAGLTGASRG